MDDAAIGKAVIDPKTYVDQHAYDELFGALRRESPVRWAAPEGYRPFWLVTRHADIIEIERQPARFVNEQRSVLTTIADTPAPRTKRRASEGVSGTARDRSRVHSNASAESERS